MSTREKVLKFTYEIYVHKIRLSRQISKKNDFNYYYKKKKRLKYSYPLCKILGFISPLMEAQSVLDLYFGFMYKIIYHCSSAIVGR